jgi:hypothetical protein
MARAGPGRAAPAPRRARSFVYRGRRTPPSLRPLCRRLPRRGRCCLPSSRQPLPPGSWCPGSRLQRPASPCLPLLLVSPAAPIYLPAPRSRAPRAARGSGGGRARPEQPPAAGTPGPGSPLARGRGLSASTLFLSLPPRRLPAICPRNQPRCARPGASSKQASTTPDHPRQAAPLARARQGQISYPAAPGPHRPAPHGAAPGPAPRVSPRFCPAACFWQEGEDFYRAGPRAGERVQRCQHVQGSRGDFGRETWRASQHRGGGPSQCQPAPPRAGARGFQRGGAGPGLQPGPLCARARAQQRLVVQLREGGGPPGRRRAGSGAASSRTRGTRGVALPQPRVLAGPGLANRIQGVGWVGVCCGAAAAGPRHSPWVQSHVGQSGPGIGSA